MDNGSSPRVLGALVGNIERQRSALTKYGLFFRAVAQHLPLVEVYDASLRGFPRLINACRMAHPDRRQWKERFYQNVPAFIGRSKQVGAHLRTLRRRVDVILQEGVLFDAMWDNAMIPNVIYTDYTAVLAARKPAAGRSPFNDEQRAQWIALEQQAFARAAHVCTRSHRVRDSIIRDSRIAPERVTAIGGGVNLRQLPPTIGRTGSATPTVLFIGKDFYRKGGDLLLRAFAQVRTQMRDARLLLLTADPIPTELPLEGVQLIAPTWDRSEIEALYRQADLFVLPSRLETWGDVLLEAMAYGLPCIGVGDQAMEEIIQDGETGLIVSPEHVGALANAILRLLSEPSLRCEMGAKGRERIEREYTWDRVVSRLVPILYEAWARSRS